VFPGASWHRVFSRSVWLCRFIREKKAGNASQIASNRLLLNTQDSFLNAEVKMMVDQQLPGLGIDGGGSHCRAWLFAPDGQVLGRGQSGPANPVGAVAASFAAIEAAATQALADAGLPAALLSRLPLAAGLAGLHLPELHQVFADWQHPFARLKVTTDVQIAAYGVHQDQDGAVFILGTGFSAQASVKGKTHGVGGFGFPINCTASGSWFGLEAVKAVLLAQDGLAQATLLSDLLFAHHGIAPGADSNAALASLYLGKGQNSYGQLAPLVFQAIAQQDAVALQLRQQALQFVEQVVLRLLDLGAPDVGFVGSLGALLQPLLPKNLPTRYVADAGERGSWFYLKQGG